MPKLKLPTDELEALAEEIRQALDYCCERCNKQCSRHGEGSGSRSESGKFALQLHHKDRNRENNDRDNWEFLCSVCHLAEHRWEAESCPGQLLLFFE